MQKQINNSNALDSSWDSIQLLITNHKVTVSHLHHLSVDVEAGVAQQSDLLGQQLHSLGGVTEDDRLVDLKLRRREVKTHRSESLQQTFDLKSAANQKLFTDERGNRTFA